MNHNEDIAFKTITVASDENAYSKKSGSLIVNGGIGCNKNIYCNTLISECLIVIILSMSLNCLRSLRVSIILREKK